MAGAEGIVLLALAALFFGKGFAPGWRTLNTDFPNYYLVARVYRQAYPVDKPLEFLAARVRGPTYPLQRLYDWTWLQRQKDYAGIEQRIVGFAPSTYFSALLMLPISYLPPLTAKRGWLVFNLLLLGLTMILLDRLTSLGLRRVAIFTFLAFDPLRTNFLYGQEYVLLLFLLALAAWLYMRGRPAASGAIMALAAAFKIYPALFLIYFLRKRQWRAVWGFGLGGVAAAGLSVLLFGFEPNWSYATEVLPWGLRGEVIDPYSIDFNSLTSLLHRLFISEPMLNPRPLVHLPILYGVLQPIGQAILLVPFLGLLEPFASGAEREKLEWGGFLVLLLTLSTSPGPYHFCMLILAAALAACFLRAHASHSAFVVFVSLYLLACFPLISRLEHFDTGWKTFLAYPRFYALLGMWGLLGWQLVLARGGLRAFSIRSRGTLGLVSIFFILVVAGVSSNLRHLRGLYGNYASRVVIGQSVLFASEPVVAGETFLFTVMGQQTYLTAKLAGGGIRYIDFRADAFHPSFSAASGEGFVEVAGTTSRIVRFFPDGRDLTAWAPTVAVEDGEKPTVSPDGRWLLFIRERGGRASLWVKPLSADAVQNQSAERPWFSSDSDVLEATIFPDNSAVFAARVKGTIQLFSGRIPNLRFDAEPPLGGATRYPAASPDGRWLAYSQEEGGNWQLWVAGVEHSPDGAAKMTAPRRLTNAQCNCTHPAWMPDSKTLVYATDCGRGLGLTALARLAAVP